jgi:protein TonB
MRFDLAINQERDWSLRLAGLLSGIAGTCSVLALVVWMNLTAKSPEREDSIRAIPMELAPPPRTPPATPKPKPRKPPPAKRLQPVPSPDLGAALSGVDFGLPEVTFDPEADQRLLGGTETETAETAVDTPPQPIATGAFDYPAEAKSKNLQGYVLLSVLVDEQGTVAQAQVIEASPPGVFEQSALAGIRRWRFNPARSQGKPVASWVQQKIVFQLG